ncbi:DNA repair protein RecN (Recombination protein N) [Magnetospirillum gryphiswaldense MSR-1 v2]|uniref:DNA repair protein RecN n=1 Tax=Magnetospirillum gryphiswaldense (strain DSM 6361 / JCM 21280 / NBRC 15271 / MSR-1) TaxID=431944 RepID=V6F5W5_MAGGM|nr:DNA repair protein RecN [Magnetospirillum gryphiswaldense]CDK99721.1 DNA repair protein RecN (Recombination protein N) [Magnetospirillum gryphiswaldense MSR-1 v2]
MLASLSIRDVVLIEKLDLSFAGGLSVFTGETGAGKSILLDSLSLTLGARADSGLVRHGAPQLTVIAEFDPPPFHPARVLLAAQDMDAQDGPLVLRRVVTADGRSRAYVNDQAVSVGLLRKVGDELVEIHGQFESHGLLDETTHLPVLDAFAGLGQSRGSVRAAWTVWREAAKARAAAEAALKQARAEEDSLRHAHDELHALAPKPGEESELAAKRAVMQHSEKLIEAMNAAQTALTQKGDVEASLRSAQRILERVAEKAEGKLNPVIAALDRAADEAAEAIGQLERVSSEIDLDPRALEKAEERLFALRAAARKHGIDVDGLAGLRDRLGAQLAALDGGGNDLTKLAKAEQAARTAYVEAARALSKSRTEGAARLDRAVAAELPPLKLDKARFTTQVQPGDENDWGPDGLDKVAFLVATNPGAPPAALGKVASGGELSRFMLALKVVLAQSSSTPTMVFDEVDSGIGGAVAAAVGERLGRLGKDVQVLVVTHSPQVAARGASHYRVAKTEVEPGRVLTSVDALPASARTEEIARMLSGENVTDHARAAAAALIVG